MTELWDAIVNFVMENGELNAPTGGYYLNINDADDGTEDGILKFITVDNGGEIAYIESITYTPYNIWYLKFSTSGGVWYFECNESNKILKEYDDR